MPLSVILRNDNMWKNIFFSASDTPGKVSTSLLAIIVVICIINTCWMTEYPKYKTWAIYLLGQYNFRKLKVDFHEENSYNTWDRDVSML